MTTLSCTLEEYHLSAKEYFNSLNELTYDQIDSGLHCLGLMYMGVQYETERQLNECAMIFSIATRKAIYKKVELING